MTTYSGAATWSQRGDVSQRVYGIYRSLLACRQELLQCFHMHISHIVFHNYIGMKGPLRAAG